MMVFVGSLLGDEKYDGGPVWELSCPRENGLEDADCDVNWVKLREGEVDQAAASGDIFEVASGREFWSILDAVEATRRLRDAIVSVERVVMTDDAGARRSSAFIGEHMQQAPMWIT